VECQQAWLKPSTVDSQSLWIFCGFPVNILPVAALRQGDAASLAVCIPGFLPTMKPQLSQLPLIVGSGRVSS
jgi:hypothetical protein